MIGLSCTQLRFKLRNQPRPITMLSEEDDFDDEEMQIILAHMHHRRRPRPRMFRMRPNHFHVWNDSEFYDRFRLSKESAMMVLEMIGDAIKHKTDWNKAVTPETMLLLALRLYASGSMLITVGDFSGVSKSTACRAVKIVSHHIALLRDRFIKFPTTREGRIKLREQFYRTARFPRVIGALDCTHVRIVSPGGENAEVFRNRKGFFSINVQTLCDPDLKITDIVSRWPGSTHDSTIFNNSVLRARFESGVIDDGSLIIADSGYPNRPYLITPLAAPNSPEEQLFNESQIRTRNCVERSYGVWKRRFPILSTGIRLKNHKKVQSIVVATAVLHNICCLNDDMNLPVLEPRIENAVHVVNNVPNAREIQNFNNSVRNAIINDHFKNLR